MNEPRRDICPGCKQEIDPDVCHCGEWIKDHDSFWSGHTPVPMGCACGYVQHEIEDEQT